MSPALQTIAFLHALASLFHSEIGWSLQSAPWLTGTSSMLVVVMAITVLLRPGDLRPFVALLVVELVDVAASLPAVPNHWMVTASTDLVLLAVAADLWRRGEDLGSRWFAESQRGMQVGVAIFYWFTGFWKLNAGFFDLRYSCSSTSWHRVLEQFPFLPTSDGVEYGIIGAVLLLELVGPITFFVPKLRAPTILIFVVFHGILGVDFHQRYLNFSSVMFGLLAWYLTADELGSIWERFRLALVGRGWAIAWTLVTIVVAGVVIAPLEAGTEHLAYWPMRYMLFLVGHAPLVLVAFATTLSWQAAPKSSWRPTVAWLLPVLIAFNGLSPWFGIKTRNSWQMYSNVRLEHDASNHFILPRSLDALGYLSDTVIIESVGDPDLQEELVGEDFDHTWFMTRITFSENPAVSVTYVRDGERHELSRAADDSELVTPPPWLIRKWVWFRPVGPEVARRCVW